MIRANDDAANPPPAPEDPRGGHDDRPAGTTQAEEQAAARATGGDGERAAEGSSETAQPAASAASTAVADRVRDDADDLHADRHRRLRRRARAEARRADERAERKASGRSRRPAPRRRRRWLLRIAVALLIFLVLVVVGIQVVMMTDLPRRLVLSALSKSLGVKAEAAAVDFGWFGDASVTDVKLTIPLEDGPFVETKKIRVKTNNLLSIVVFGVEVQSITVDSPLLHLRQSQSGRWNVADFLGQIGRGGGGGGSSTATGPDAPAPGAKPARPEIPAINVQNALVEVTDRAGRTSRVGPVHILGTPDAALPELVWNYEVGAANQFKVTGRLATGGEWRHEAKVEVTDLKPLLAPFAPTAPEVKLTGRWDGRAAGDGVTGHLAIDRMTVNGIPVRGTLGVETGGGGGAITVRPQGLQLLGTDPAGKPMLIADTGAVVYQNGQLKTEGLLIRGGGGVAKVDADFNVAAKTGGLKAEWAELAVPAGVAHGGNLSVKMGQTLTGRVNVDGQLNTSGHLEGGESRGWAGRVDLKATGPSFADLTATVSFPKFEVYSPQQRVPFDGLAVRAAVSDNLGSRPGADLQRRTPGVGIALESVTLGGTDRLSASGFFLPGSKQWELKFNGKRWPLPYVDEEALAIDLEAAGDADAVRVRRLRVAASDTVVTVLGAYVFDAPNPLDVRAELDHTPPSSKRDAIAIGVSPKAPPLVFGRLAGRGRVRGTLSPLNLKMGGEFQGLDVKAAGHDVGLLSFDIKGYADQYAAKVWRDEEQPYLAALGGKWDLKAEHRFDQGYSRLEFAVRDWNLKELGHTVGQEALSGTAEGGWWFHLPKGNDPARRVLGGGSLALRKLNANGFDVDAVDVGMTLADGRLELPVTAKRLGGTASLAVKASVDDLRSVEVHDLKVDKWPLALPPSTYLELTGGGPLVTVMLPDADSPVEARRKLHFTSGPIKFSTPVKVRDVDAGDASAIVVLRDRTAELMLLQAKLFDSRTEASAKVDLDHPNATTMKVAVTGVDPERMLDLIPSLRGLSGKFDLYAQVQPDANPYALEPLVLDATFDSHGLLYRNYGRATNPATLPSGTGVQVGDGRFRVLMNLTDQFDLERAVLADQAGTYRPATNRNGAIGAFPPNTMELAGGRLTFWGRMTYNRNDRARSGFDTRTIHGRLAFEALDFNQLMQAAKPDGNPTPGLVDGAFILYGTTRIDEALTAPTARAAVGASTRQTADELSLVEKTIASLQGEGTVKLRNADIGNINVIASLYSLMRVGQDVRAPTGNGEAAFRIENDHVFLTAFRYFNRGLEVRATADLSDVHKFTEANVRGDAFGSVRALKDIELPILRSIVPDIDEILSAVQSSGVSVTFSGPVQKPAVKPVLFRELGDSIRELLTGDFKKAKKIE